MEAGRSFERKTMKGRWQLIEEPQSAQWLEKRRVAAALRQLGETCLRSDVEAETLGVAADELERIEGDLSSKLGPTFFDALANGRWEADQGHFADRNPFLCQARNPAVREPKSAVSASRRKRAINRSRRIKRIPVHHTA